jgi:Flp pilus assembly protein TadD
MAERRTHTIQGVARAQPPGDGDFDLGPTFFRGDETSRKSSAGRGTGDFRFGRLLVASPSLALALTGVGWAASRGSQEGPYWPVVQHFSLDEGSRRGHRVAAHGRQHAVVVHDGLRRSTHFGRDDSGRGMVLSTNPCASVAGVASSDSAASPRSGASGRLHSALWAALTVCVSVPLTVLVMRWRAPDGRAAPASSAVAVAVAQDYLALGYGYLQQKRPGESLLPLTEAARLDPKNDAVQNNLCFAHQLLGRTADARKACERALELNPANQLARNNLAWVNGPASAAAPAHPAAAPPPPAAAPAQPAAANPVARPEDELLQRGLALYQRGEYQQSIDVWQQALAINPQSARAFNNIGTGQIKLGQYEQAQAMFRRALSLEPGTELYRNNLAWAESERAKKH